MKQLPLLSALQIFIMDSPPKHSHLWNAGLIFVKFFHIRDTHNQMSSKRQKTFSAPDSINLPWKRYFAGCIGNQRVHHKQCTHIVR